MYIGPDKKKACVYRSRYQKEACVHYEVQRSEEKKPVSIGPDQKPVSIGPDIRKRVQVSTDPDQKPVSKVPDIRKKACVHRSRYQEKAHVHRPRYIF